MNPRKPDPADDSPTGENDAIEFDGAQTIQLDDTYRFQVVCASENLDTAAADPAAKTFDELKALNADVELAISQKVQELGYLERVGNPYNTAGPTKPK